MGDPRSKCCRNLNNSLDKHSNGSKQTHHKDRHEMTDTGIQNPHPSKLKSFFSCGPKSLLADKSAELPSFLLLASSQTERQTDRQGPMEAACGRLEIAEPGEPGSDASVAF